MQIPPNKTVTNIPHSHFKSVALPLSDDQSPRPNPFGFCYIELLMGKGIHFPKGTHPMASVEKVRTLYPDDQPVGAWLSELVEGFKSSGFDPMMAEIDYRGTDGDNIYVSLPMALGATLLDPSFQGMIGRIPILEAGAGHHDEDSLAHALDVCIDLFPDNEGRIDLRVMHEYLGVKEPFSLWSGNAFKRYEIQIGTDVFKSPKANANKLGFLVSPSVAVTIASESNTPRGRQLRKFVGRCLVAMQPDPFVRWGKLPNSVKGAAKAPGH